MTDLTTSQLGPAQDQVEGQDDQQQNLSGIKVIARIRPFLAKEVPPQQPCIYKSGNAVCAQDPNNPALKTETEFDMVLGPENNQQDVFKEMIPYLRCVMGGVNMLQINYGVTSSGKTYTLFGTNENAGMLEQSVEYIKQQLPDINIHISVVQIYLNQITDLLNSNQPLKVYATQADPLPQRKFEQIQSSGQLRELIQRVDSLREKSATMNNSQSSRSHCLIFVVLSNDAGGQSSICFADLAGSEPFQAQGSRLLQQESSFIRTSLLMLDKAIRDLRAVTSLSGNSVSFRSSQLTMCLRPYLQPKLKKDAEPGKPQFQLPGNVFMILNLHGLPSGYSSNRDTLNLGFICKQVKNYAKTPSRLGDLGRSVNQLMQSVTSMNRTTETNKSQLLQDILDPSYSGQDVLIIKQADWDQIQQQFENIDKELQQIDKEREEEIRKERQSVVSELTEIYELEIQQLKANYEQEIYERDIEILQLKRQFGII